MKAFQTLDELWSFCLYCPICQESSRTILLSVGPDDEFKLTEYQKVDSELKLFCSYHHDPKSSSGAYSVNFIVDCANNTYCVQGGGVDQQVVKKAQDAYFFCYLYGTCYECDRTYVNSSDLEFRATDKTVTNIRIEQEAVYFLEDKFHINLLHDRNVMVVSPLGDPMMDDLRNIELPLVNLDFSKVPKVINKIKTLILFS
jgi:hypothetical protein